MENNKHSKTKKIFKIAGITLALIALACIITGFADFFIKIRNEEMPSLFFLLIIGFPCLGVGLALTMAGFRKEIMNYVKNESVPVINDMNREIAPGIGAIADAIKNSDTQTVTCKECGEQNPADSNFCKKCGATLKHACPDCNAPVDGDSLFCPRCGRRL